MRGEVGHLLGDSWSSFRAAQASDWPDRTIPATVVGPGSLVDTLRLVSAHLSVNLHLLPGVPPASLASPIEVSGTFREVVDVIVSAAGVVLFVDYDSSEEMLVVGGALRYRVDVAGADAGALVASVLRAEGASPYGLQQLDDGSVSVFFSAPDPEVVAVLELLDTLAPSPSPVFALVLDVEVVRGIVLPKVLDPPSALSVRFGPGSSRVFVFSDPSASLAAFASLTDAVDPFRRLVVVPRGARAEFDAVSCLDLAAKGPMISVSEFVGASPSGSLSFRLASSDGDSVLIDADPGRSLIVWLPASQALVRLGVRWRSALAKLAGGAASIARPLTMAGAGS